MNFRTALVTLLGLWSFYACAEGETTLRRDTGSSHDAAAVNPMDSAVEDAASIDVQPMDTAVSDVERRDTFVASNDSATVDVATVDVYRPACRFIRVDDRAMDTVAFALAGGMMASFGCAPIDPTYWMSADRGSVTINFVHPESRPAIRVWGMNSDDTASIAVNGVPYPLTAASASYNAKVVCGISPGPDGVAFVGGNLTGANSPATGNYSHQDVSIHADGVQTITVRGLTGAGWGLAGITIGCGCMNGTGQGC